MKRIELTKGDFVFVDDSDYENLNKWNWWSDKGYAARTEKFIEEGIKKKRSVYMHRVLNSTPPGMDTDHIDGNIKNNSRANLRTVTKSQNQMNQKIRIGHGSKYKGVSWRAESKKWRAYITLDGKFKSLGVFTNEEEAAMRYDEFAKTMYGSFAKLNF